MIIWIILAVLFFVSCLVGGGYSVGFQDGYNDAKEELKGDKDKGGEMKIYEAFNWIKDADYTPHGFLIFNENTPEGQLKGEALKTIFEAAKNGELVPVELFNQVKKERDNLEKLKQKTITIKQLEEMYDKFQKKLWREHENVRGDDMVEIGYAEQFLQDLLMEFGCWEEADEGQLNK